MKILIIEDEALAVQNLKAILKELEPDADIVGVCSSVRESVLWLSANTADLILLDIHLSDGLSFKIFEQVQVNTPVILTTAYDQYAIKAFELNSIDYIIKPIKVADMKRSINKFRMLAQPKTVDYQNLIDILGRSQPKYRQRFSVNFGGKIKSVDINDIACFYILGKSVFICTMSGQSYDLGFSLDQLEKELSPVDFFRISRQMIINHKAIENMYFLSNRTIKIEAKVKTPVEAIVSILRLSEFKNWLNR